MLMMDGLMRYELLGGKAIAMIADTSRLCEEARRVHDLGRVASAALGRTLTAASLMAVSLKGEGDAISLIVDGGGPIGKLIAVANSDGGVKGCVDVPDVDLPRKNGKLDVGGAVGNKGFLTVVRDMGMREPYVGRVRLATGEIGEDVARYYVVSEQIPSVVSLGVLVGERVESAGGVVIQAMPGCDEASLHTLELSAPLLVGISGTIRDLGLEGAAKMCLEGLEPRLLAVSRPRYHCDCSRERMERALVSLGEKELTEMIEEQHGAQLECHFCNTRHDFSERELRELLERAKSKPEA